MSATGLKINWLGKMYFTIRKNALFLILFPKCQKYTDENNAKRVKVFSFTMFSLTVVIACVIAASTKQYGVPKY